MKKYILNLLVFSAILSAQTSPTVYWVDGTNGSDNSAGTTEATAWKTVHKVFAQSLFKATVVDTVKIKAGTYDFKNAEIYTNSSYDFVLIGVEGSSKTIFDAQSTNRHMTIDDGQSNKTRIQGITFKNGYSNSWPGGGSIYLTYGSDVQFTDCVWENNSTIYNEGGGAVHIRDEATPTFTSCVFEGNYVKRVDDFPSSGDSNGGSSYGGAVRIMSANNKTDLENAVVFKKTTFINNYAHAKYASYGGAISSDRSLTVENCLFVKNYGLSHDGGIWQDGMGGAIYFNATRWNNNSYDGGTMLISNSTFHGNYLKVLSESYSNLFGAAISYGQWQENAKTYIFNTVITGSKILINDTNWDTDDSNQLKKYIIGAGNLDNYKITVDYSNIQAPKIGKGWGDYVYDVTPAYKDTTNGDYSLSDKSPLIGGGVLAWTDEGLAGPTEDLLGSTRPSPSGSNPDMGAYENSLATSDAPMPVTGIVITAATKGASLSWSKNKENLGSSTDAENIEYQIYVDGTNVAQTTATSYNVTGLTNGTTYKFSVSAKNTSTNKEGSPSAQISIIPLYKGPRWHVASIGGSPIPTTTSIDYNYGSTDSPINHLTNAFEVAADGDTIVMMKGTHTGSNNRAITINSSKKLVITGDLGFSADQTVMDGGGRDRFFKFDYDVDSTFVIQHITLYNGLAGDDYGGGAIFINNGQPKLHKIIFKSNVDSSNSWRGGGALSIRDNGSVIVDSCIFDGNRVSRYSTNSTDNENFNNSANGGAISFHNTYSRSIVRSSTLKNNKAYARYGAQGSAIYMQNDVVDITNNLIYDNETRSSMGNSSNSQSLAAVFYADGPQTYSGNKWQGATTYLVNNTIVNNIASSDKSNSHLMSGVYYCGHTPPEGVQSSVVYSFNNIIYGNINKLSESESELEEYPLQLHCGEPIMRMDYNLIYNANNLKHSGGSGQKYFNYDYTLDVDPGFKDPANGDFSLSDASLAIGAGVSDWTDWGVKAPATDMLGGARPNPSGSAPDLGPYENALANSPYPKQVKNVTAVGGSGSVTLTWDANSETDITYKVYKHTSAFNIATTYYVGLTTDTKYTITGLDNATRYFFRVSAVNKDDYEGTASNTIDITPTYTGPVWWVSTTGNDDTGEGSSGNPYKSLKHAIEHVSSGDTIMIKPGTYSGADNRNIYLDPNDQGANFSRYKNLVITSEKGAAETIFDAGNNGRHFRMKSNSNGSIDSTMQFIGLTFRGGRMNEDGGSFHLSAEEYYSDPYWRAYRLNPKFVNCVFIDNAISSSNSTVSGGAFYLTGASPIFESCVFDSNYAMRGGAIASGPTNQGLYRDTLWIRNSTIKNNAVDDSQNPQNNGVRGGGVYFYSGINAMIYNSVFENNAAVSYNSSGGGVYGGGLDVDSRWSAQFNPMVWIVNSRFSKNKIDHKGGNTNTHGGGIHMGAPHTIINTVIDSNKATFSGGNGKGMGGGLFISVQSQWDGNGNEFYGNSHLVNSTIVNNLVSGNSDIGESGGVYLNYPSTRGYWFNNIFWGNRANVNQDQDQYRHNLSYHEAQHFNLITDYNDIEFMEHYMDTWAGPNSYNMDPGFINSASNFKLADASPLIGLGTSIYDGFAGPKYDMLNAKRPNPAGSNPDLGAYENALAESPNPKQVRSVVAHPGGESVTLSWSANNETDIEKYLIYASTQMNFIPTQEDSVGETTDTTFTVTSLTNGTEYHFKITAQDIDGYTGVYSNEVHAIPKYSGPTWWVDVINGQDKCDGSPESPCPHLSYIFPIMANGDTIRMMAGDYGPGYHLEGKNNEWGNNLQELTIIGNTGNPEDVNIWGNDNQQIFQLNDMRVTFRNIAFVNGSVGDGFPGGAIATNYGGLTIDNCIFENNKAQGQYGVGGAIYTYMTGLIINNSIFRNNKSKQAGGAISIYTDETGDPDSTIFVNITDTQFINNQTHGDDQSGNAKGGAIFVRPSTKFEMNISHSIFDNNSVYCQHDGSGAAGSAILIEHQSIDSWNNVKPIVIAQNIFKNNWGEVKNNTNWMDGTVRTGWSTHIINSLFLNNRLQSSADAVGGTSGVAFSFGESTGSEPDNLFVNNTVIGNMTSNSTGGIPSNPINFYKAYAIVFNNIIWDNNGDNGGVGFHQENSGVKANDNNNIEYMWGEQSNFGANTISVPPKFKNPSNENYQLSNSSQLIDKGANELAGAEAPRVDIRGYYRVGSPDIGAYEAGASKYLLQLADDVETNFDTTFVELGQKLKYTITTNDIEGNQVGSNESVSWNIFPNDKYVKFVSGDITTEGGDASATFQVTQQTRGKGFRFRIDIGVGEAFLRSPMYVVEELVTGAPPPVLSLILTPDSWSNNPEFNLQWDTPDWAEKRDLIGAVVEITDGYNNYNQFLSFPSGDTLTDFTFSVPEPGAFHTEVWLVDEYGNEDQDSARSATAYFDNVMPETFHTYNPKTFGPDVFYSSDKPRFEWDDMGDYPSGIKHWDIYTWQNGDQHKYGTYTRSDITIDSNNPNRAYINGSAALTDGYYDWWAVAIDSASNATHSDTAHFGVDLSPPHISHPSPLGTIDAGSTTPSINVFFSDGASGVKYGNLHYRRSGSGGGFVTLDLMSGPVSIPGSDVKENGLEYWIDTEDNVGNYNAWPGIGELHAVSVRSEGSITTADSWSNGVPGGTDSTNYLFFSIPFEVGNAKSAITSIMGTPDEFSYRLFSYNNGWQEDPPSVTMGNAYFFIFDPDKYAVDGQPTKIEFNFGQGTSTPTDPPYGIGVSSGQWKFFGSPYNYNVPLDNVYTEDEENIRDAGSIYTWSGSWSSPGSSLLPWKGYIFKSGGATELNIDARGSGFGKMAKAMNTDDYPMDADEWIIDMIATTGNARDELNAVGVRNMAEDGYDRLDEFEPPAVMGDIVLRIDNRDREETPDLYAKDIRKPNETGHYWDLQVFTPTNGGRTYLTFDGLGYIPEEYDIFLINKTTKQAKNLEWESSYRFANTGSESHLRQDLRLVVGTKDYVKENNAGVELYPDAFTLAQNYPNPFNPQTSIMISLEEDAQLNLIIFNLLGEEVTRLAMNEHRPAGYYTFIWNGTNAMGSKVSTGVYFYHAMIRDAQGKVVLNKTRKMIFLK